VTRPVYVFTDLDDTLFQTRGKCGDGPVHEAAYDKEGAPLSYHTEEQLALLGLFGTATLIPVTGRNLAALNRVRSVRFPWLRVTSHGALVLDAEEKLLPSWARLLDAELATWEARFEDALAYAHDRIKTEGLSLRAKVIHDQDIPVYVSIKGESDEIAAMSEAFRPLWSEGVVHRNGHNMALLPPYASKARAVEHIMALIREEAAAPPLFVGLGDSLTDVPFLKLCHFALTPQGSQIHQEAWA
jgi:hydroxymethylpyrimidine pyrophosphatase-like HAD family hydrolase